jgi:hypothetical protein
MSTELEDQKVFVAQCAREQAASWRSGRPRANQKHISSAAAAHKILEICNCAKKKERNATHTACIRIFMRPLPRACAREMNIFKKLFSVSSHVAINFEFTSFLLSHMGVIYDSHLLAAVFCAWDIELLGPWR